METIRSYIENLFLTFPENEEVKKIKQEMLSNMEEKYNLLKNMGKSENEAIGIVISEFGNIDELIQEMGIVREEKELDKVYVSREEAMKFLEVKKETGRTIGIGVVLCILGVAALIGVGAFFEENISASTIFNNDLGGILGFVILLICVAIAVALFIPAGMRVGKYEYLKKNIFLSEGVKREIEEIREDFMRKFVVGIVTGVVLCIFSAIPLVLLSYLEEAYSYIGIVILLVIVSFAVFTFVRIGNMYGAYDILLQRGDYSPKNKKADKIIGAVASVIWPLTVAAFLIWGLVFNGWWICWILFPIVGIMFGAFSALVSVLVSE